ncbi:MAG: hypothetical protein GXO21_05090 [Aquificae bacterium]|nr:hypothetical protein [Aquificota bacterium]
MKNIKNILIAIILFLFSRTCIPQEIQKPFVIEHFLHKHFFNFVNTTVYQQIENYGALYNTSHIFSSIVFNNGDEIFINASLTFGNGIISKLENKGYTFPSTADDLEAYLKNINNSGRKYLLELFYQKKLHRFTIIAGIIDSTSFIDVNKYANDEHTQFLNSMFVNNPIALLPSYNLGSYISYKLTKSIKISTVYMENKPDKGNVGIVEIEYKRKSFST